jgi:hypothetical protein
VRHVAIVVLLAGCGQRDERFLTEGVDALCLAASDCAGTYPPETCVEALRTGLDAAPCTFDPRAADDCTEALEEGAACVALEPFTLRVLEVPEACREAFDCGKQRDWTEAISSDLPPAAQAD